MTYDSETWWNGVNSTPPTGQGGFGTSKFFTAPYQSKLSGSANRSVPDVVVSADPVYGVILCQADSGGCPNGLLYGGTSSAAPTWAAFTAILNQEQGSNLGFLNPLVYPLADSGAFHNAASMGTDFAHVGLGSPNLNNLHLQLSGKTVGPANAANSMVSVLITGGEALNGAAGIPADGTLQTGVVVRLEDGNNNFISGKKITVSAGKSSAVVTPSGPVLTDENGAAVFTVGDKVVEHVTLSATDSTDGVVLTQTAQAFHLSRHQRQVPASMPFRPAWLRTA